MDKSEVEERTYKGICYLVVEIGGRVCIGLQAQQSIALELAGANMSLTTNIGDKNPEIIMEELIKSIPTPS